MKQVNTDEIIQLSKFFKVLSDKTRLGILTLLATEELNVTQLTEKLRMEQSAVSHQLKVLRDQRLVATRRDKKAIIYRLNDQHVYQLLSQTIEHLREEEEDMT